MRERELDIAEEIVDGITRYAPDTFARWTSRWGTWNELRVHIPFAGDEVDWDLVDMYVESLLAEYYRFGESSVSLRTPLKKIARELRERGLAPRGTTITLYRCSRGPCYDYRGVPQDVALCPVHCEAVLSAEV